MGKKIIRLLLAFSLLAAAVQPAVVHGEEMTAEEKYNKLVEQGIFDGFPDGQSHLDWNMSRAQAAKIITLILGLDPDAAAGSGYYIDLGESDWAAGYIGAATAAGILEGYSNGIFDPTSDVTIEQLAKIMVKALDIEVDEDATVEGASDWAGKYVKAALEAGLIPPQSDYTVPASRDLLVVASYAAYEQLQETAEETAWITSAQQKGARKVQLTFNGKLDPDTAVVVLERIGDNGKQRIAVGIERLEWSIDEGSVTAVLEEKIQTGLYEVFLTVPVDEKTTTSEWQFNMTAERLERIELGGADSLPRADGVEVPIHLYNQFGEEMDERPDIFAVSGSHETKLHPERNVVLLNLSRLAVGSSVTVAVLADDRFANRTYTVGGEPELRSVEAAGFVDASGTPVSSLKKGETAYLLLRPLDQFGNLITDLDWLNENLRAEAMIHDFRPLTLPKTLVAGPGGAPAVTVTGGSYLRDTEITVTVYSNLGSVLAQASIMVPTDLELPRVPAVPSIVRPIVFIDPNSIVTVSDAAYYDFTTYFTVTTALTTDLYYALVDAEDFEVPTEQQIIQQSGLPSMTADYGHVKVTGSKMTLQVEPNLPDRQYKLYVVGTNSGQSVSSMATAEINTLTQNVFKLIKINDQSDGGQWRFGLSHTPTNAQGVVYYLITDNPFSPTASNLIDEVVQFAKGERDESESPLEILAKGYRSWNGTTDIVDAGPASASFLNASITVVLEYRGVRLWAEDTLTF